MFVPSPYMGWPSSAARALAAAAWSENCGGVEVQRGPRVGFPSQGITLLQSERASRRRHGNNLHGMAACSGNMPPSPAPVLRELRRAPNPGPCGSVRCRHLPLFPSTPGMIPPPTFFTRTVPHQRNKFESQQSHRQSRAPARGPRAWSRGRRRGSSARCRRWSRWCAGPPA